MNIQYKFFRQTSIALAMLFSANVVYAADGIATEQIDTGGLTLVPTISYDSAVLRVSSDQSDITTEFSAEESIRFNSGSLSDATYQYELRLTSVDPNGREGVNESIATQNGSFKVSNGVSASTFEVKTKVPTTSVEEVYVQPEGE